MDYPQTNKISFSTMISMSGLDYQALLEIAKRANIEQRVIDAMYTGVPVQRDHAETILAAISAYTGKTWNLDTVKVVLLENDQ